jgi:hypothetical protein
MCFKGVLILKQYFVLGSGCMGEKASAGARLNDMQSMAVGLVIII